MCTIGPASVPVIRQLVETGMDVARINFSHGTPEDHRAYRDAVQTASQEAGRVVSILTDLSGPKIRIGELTGGEATLETGTRFVLRPGAEPGNAHGVCTTYERIASDLQPGDRILLADGAVELRALVCDGQVTSEVIRGGTIRSHAGVNVPSYRVSLPAITDRDREDIRAAMDIGADFIAQSFVRKAEDVTQLKALIGSDDVRVIAKIETAAAVEDFEAILRVADAIMVARGDLGVEVPYSQVPLIQKDLLRRAVQAGVPVIVATQMLESMVDAPRPTRAEATDVANSVFDGTDAVMLSAESAIGRFPVEAAHAALTIAGAADAKGELQRTDRRLPPPSSQGQAVARAAVSLAAQGHLGAIVCFTRSGATADLLAAARPMVPVYALTPDPAIARRLTLRRAVIPIVQDLPEGTADVVGVIQHEIWARGLVPAGSSVVIVGSSPAGEAQTNLLKIHQIGS